MTRRIPVTRRIVDRLRELGRASELAEAEARGILLGLGIAGEVTGWDDGDEPALLIAGPPPE